MKIYTKVVYQWVGDELVKVDEESFDYEGQVAQAKGGGGGGNQYYENLNRLYGIQADQAEMLAGVARDTVIPAYRGLVDDARGYGSQANQELAATEAMADSRAATDYAARATADELISMGIDPSQQRYANMFGDMQRRGAASQAAAATGARRNREQMGFARMQDVVSLGFGTPTSATAAANSAANTANAQLSAYNNQMANQQNAIGNAVRGGMNIAGWGADKGWFGAADGGLILGLKRGGYVQKLAAGGMAGPGIRLFGVPNTPPPPPPGAAPQTSTAQTVGSAIIPAAATGKLGAVAGKGISGVGRLTGSEGLQSFGSGLANPGASTALQQAGTAARLGTAPGSAQTSMLAAQEAGMYSAGENLGALASQQVNALLPEVVGSTALEAGTAAAAETAGTALAAEAGAGMAGLAGATLGTAIPVIGAGLAVYGIGSELGWWADGGRVTPGTHGARGGEVDGPGGPKDDMIPAMLSDGEFVLPVGTVKKYGLAKLEKMRQEGLEFEKQLGIGRA